MKAWTVPADEDAGTLTIDGAAKTVATTAGGQNGFIKFTGKAKREDQDHHVEQHATTRRCR